MKELKICTAEDYQKLVSLYLSGDYELLEKKLQNYQPNSFKLLIEARICYNQGNYSATNSVLQNIEWKAEIYSQQDKCLLQADYYFIKGRLEHYLHQPSKDYFLKAADFYALIFNWGAVSRSLYNSLLDDFEKEDHRAFSEALQLIQKKDFFSTVVQKTYFTLQVSFYEIGLQVYKKNFSIAFDLYLGAIFDQKFSQLPIQDQNFIHLYAIESSLGLRKPDLAVAFFKKIKNANESIQQSLYFLNTVSIFFYKFDFINDQKQVDHDDNLYRIDFSKILNPIRQLYFELEKIHNGSISLSQNISLDFKNDKKNSLLYQFVNLLTTEMTDRYSLAEKLYGQVQDADLLVKNQKKIENLIFRFNQISKKYCIKTKNNIAAVYLKQTTQILGRKEILISLLSSQAKSLDSLVLFFYFRDQCSKELSDYKNIIYKIISIVNSEKKFKIYKTKNVYQIIALK